MGERSTGIVITQKELYDLVQEVTRSLQRIEARLDILESKIATANNADERSRKALNMAEDANQRANEAFEKAKEVETRQLWLLGIIIVEVISGAIGALFYFAQKGIGG
ncbi:MAG: alanine-zipper protein [Thermoactinomyces sp.]